ncbi:UNVERIFIED_CONTAM: hypothetical protein GTU68_058203 [Idotea baltica]|nr:hypothetical protein [Idotea baltica]
MADLQKWDVEDPQFWDSEGKKIANRNLWISIPSLLCGFAVWLYWGIITVQMLNLGFPFAKSELFTLMAISGLTGATLRIPSSFFIRLCGGRNTIFFTTALLMLPAIGAGIALQDMNTPLWKFQVLALLSGFGGGNFASSMSNISFFFPKKQQGLALGLNAGLGNFGVTSMQILVPLAMTFGLFGAMGTLIGKIPAGTEAWIQNAGFVWLLFLVPLAFLGWFGMNNLRTQEISPDIPNPIFDNKHTWVMSVIYTMTFGSFIGFAASFPLSIKVIFGYQHIMVDAWMGPFIGALIRPVGGWISDKVGGALVTQICSVVMIGSALGVAYYMKAAYGSATPEQFFLPFFMLFLLLFAATGIGNGSTFRTIAMVFPKEQAGPVLGWTSAIAAYGAFYIPKVLGEQIKATTPEVALIGFASFYAVCVLINWFFYLRKNGEFYNP